MIQQDSEGRHSDEPFPTATPACLPEQPFEHQPAGEHDKEDNKGQEAQRMIVHFAQQRRLAQEHPQARRLAESRPERQQSAQPPEVLFLKERPPARGYKQEPIEHEQKGQESAEEVEVTVGFAVERTPLRVGIADLHEGPGQKQRRQAT